MPASIPAGADDQNPVIRSSASLTMPATRYAVCRNPEKRPLPGVSS